MFIMYDKKMNVIPFPEGVIPLDIFISSIDKERNRSRVEGSNRTIEYGLTYNARDIRLELLLKAEDTMDYRLLRNQIYAMFPDEFYVSEEYDKGKRYLVSVDERFIPERIPKNQRYAEATINCTKLGIPFAESIGTTLGTERVNILPLDSRLWEQGYINNSGSEVDRTTSVRTKNYIPVYAVDYEISLEKGNRLYIRQYDASKNYLDVPNISVGEGGKDVITLDERTSYIKAYINADEDITPIDIGGRLIASVTALLKGINAVMGSWGYGMGLIYDEDAYRYSFLISSLNSAFKVYNAGNVPIHPFEQDLKIEIYNILGSADTLELINKTNGTTFKVYEGSTSSATVITLDGPNVTRNGQAYLRSTNRQFIELEPGWNEFELRGPRSVGIDFDFRFYYK